MRKHTIATPLLLAALAQGIHCTADGRFDFNNYSGGPGNLEPRLECRLTPLLQSTEVPFSAGVCTIIPIPDPFDPTCSCEDYQGMMAEPKLPPNIIDAYWSSGVPTIDGCNTDTDFMWPACSTVAEASGVVAKAYHTPTKANPGDNDRVFDLCPTKNTMFIDPFDRDPMEIRAGESFILGNDVIGRIHIEVQDCRYYDGTYTFDSTVLPLLSAGKTLTMEARPGRGELMTVAGDWITDDGLNFDPSHVGHTELHEARFIAKVLPDIDKVQSVIITSGFFARNTRQEDRLRLDVFVLPSPNPTSLNKFDCFEVFPLEQNPLCGRSVGANLLAVTPSDDGRCILKVERDPSELEPLNFGCWDICDDDAGPGFLEAPGAYCNNVHFTGTFEGIWKDPADLWMCQCPCDDPSAPGATISAPVQGCAQMDLDPSKPEDQQIACAQVCGGQICGAAPACRIGECHAPASGGTAQLIARGVCDPALPQPIARVSASGDYHVTIDGDASSLEYHIGDETIPSNLDGTLHFNLNESGGIAIVDFAESRLFPDNFTIHSLNITNSTVVSSSRVFGQFTNATAFLIPAEAGSFGAEGLISGTHHGQELLNPQPLTGMIDMQTREVALDIIAENSEGEGAGAEKEEASVVAHIVGTIDNVPPIAVSGGPTRTVECTSPTLTPVILNGSQSFDSDPGDSISHYQWFTAAGLGVGNHAVVSTNLPLGHSAFALHVYDADLGSAAAPLDVNVVDSIAPTLTLTPPSSCMWPPDHKRIRFRLGTDITATAADTCDAAPTVRIINVTSSQPDNFPGDGNTVNDASFTDHAFCIRRERTTQLGERLYLITVEARDANGNTTTKVLPIRVAANNSGGGSCPSIGTIITDNAPCE